MEISHFYFLPRVRRNIRNLYCDLGFSSSDIADIYRASHGTILWCLQKLKIKKAVMFDTQDFRK